MFPNLKSTTVLDIEFHDAHGSVALDFFFEDKT